MADSSFQNQSNRLAACYSEAFGVANYESVFRFKKFKMADPIWWTALFNIYQIRLKLVTRGLSGSLITTLESDFKNSKWRMQYGGRLFLKSIESAWSLLLGGFRGRWLRICIEISKIQIGGSNMANGSFQNQSNPLEVCYSEIFGVAETNDTLFFHRNKW